MDLGPDGLAGAFTISPGEAIGMILGMIAQIEERLGTPPVTWEAWPCKSAHLHRFGNVCYGKAVSVRLSAFV